MPGVITTFGSQSGSVPASSLDTAFASAATLTQADATDAVVAALPTATTPSAPTAGGSVGVAATLARADHKHPPQSAVVTTNTGAVSITSAMDGTCQEHNNTTGATYTFSSTLAAGTSGLVTQISTGQVTFAAGGTVSIRNSSGYTKTRTQWSQVSWQCRANPGTAPEIVLSGDMAA